MAPELPGAEETIKYLTSAGVRVAAGHTNATYDELIRGVDWGVSSIAHAGNAIRMIHQREPGVLGAMLLEDVYKRQILARDLGAWDDFLPSYSCPKTTVWYAATRRRWDTKA